MNSERLLPRYCDDGFRFPGHPAWKPQVLAYRVLCAAWPGGRCSPR